MHTNNIIHLTILTLNIKLEKSIPILMKLKFCLLICDFHANKYPFYISIHPCFHSIKIVSGYILKALNIDLKLHEFILGIWSSTWWLLTSQQIKINILTIMSISLSSLVDSYFTHANISHHIFYFLFPYQKKYQIHYT